MRRSVSFLLVFALLITSSFSVFASEEVSFNESTGFRMYDESIEDYITIKVIKVSDIESRSQGIDSNNNVVYDYTYNAENSYVYDNIMKKKTFLKDDTIKKINNSKSITTSSDTFTYTASGDPNYCTYPDPLEFGVSLKLVVNAGITSAAALVTFLSPIIVSKIGISMAAVESGVNTVLSAVAGDILSTITSGGDMGKDINFKAHYTCEHMCTWDMGEECFYGDALDELEYLGIY